MQYIASLKEALVSRAMPQAQQESSLMKRVDSAKSDLGSSDAPRSMPSPSWSQAVVDRVYGTVRYSKEKLAAMGKLWFDGPSIQVDK